MFAKFFVDRPIFATVLSIVIVIIGGVAYTRLPVAQYPDVVPPTISVTASFPGADAKTVAETVATPIEQEVNGVERMLYMSSKSTNDGQMTLDVTFELGTDLDTAQVLVQNRVSIALSKLPEDVRRIGVTTKKKSPSILLCVNLVSAKRADGSYYYDQLHLSNFATLNIKDDLARINGVGDVNFLGARDYSMRIWLNPNKLASLQLTASDVVRAVKEQNVQVAAGRLGQPPVPAGSHLAYQLPILAQGRLQDEEQFENIVVQRGDLGQLVYLRDVVAETKRDAAGRVVERGIELGAKNYEVDSYLDGEPTITIAIFQLPGSNALATAEAVRAKMEQLKDRFPKTLDHGRERHLIDYKIVYDTTVFIDESLHEVYKTLLEAFVLVFIVVLIFLQDWRATLLPMIDVPVSLIGTFAVMAALGFSLNNLTLFGLVLAIGIVVDDAIVVVENVERWMSKGLPPREATLKAMAEITGPVIAITLVLSSVFIPTAFLAGITGQFYRQFALTIAASTIISAINAMTMAPARAVTLIRPHATEQHTHGAREILPRWGLAILLGLATVSVLQSPVLRQVGGVHVAGGHATASPAITWATRAVLFTLGGAIAWIAYRPINAALAWFLGGFNRTFDRVGNLYGHTARGLLRASVIMLVLYGGLLALTGGSFSALPKGFIPNQDKGYLVVEARLPDGASLERTEAIVSQMARLVRNTPGVAHTLELPGYSVLLSTNQSNSGGMFVVLDPFEDRAGKRALSAGAIMAALRPKLASLWGAEIAVFGAPPVEGIGSTGGFKMQVQDRRAAGLAELEGAVKNLAAVGMAQPGMAALFSTFSVAQPQLYVDIDREKAKSQGVSLDEIHLTLQACLGSYYINDFTFQDRNWQVNVQADPKFRQRTEDIGRLEVRNADGHRVPLSSMIKIRDVSGPALVNHYNLYPSAELNGIPAPTTSAGQAVALMERLASDNLPGTMGYEWTELTLQQVLASRDTLSKLIFPLAVVFVFMVLAAQYESWSLPLAILLIVPMCILAALIGVWLVGLDINIFVQIGLIVLIALAAKNAILVVEYSKQMEDQGTERIEAIVSACRLRLRPILMTSLAFILGVAPLVTSKGAGAEMRFSLGVAVLSGMIGVTFFGLFFTPVFYYVIRWLTTRDERRHGARQDRLETPPGDAPPTEVGK
ncbi:MAG: efflux RND transporter permease subunit [Pirellulales bacterium]|nr:efflux RND transporter permease subunit [Pirellulales bacterium]